MSNVTNADDDNDDLGLSRPVVLGPIAAVVALLVILLGISVVVFTRNRQARIARLRERIGLAESRVNVLLRLHQMAEEVKNGVNKQGSDEINKEKDQRIRDNDRTSSVNTLSTQQTKLSTSSQSQPPTTSTSERTVTECNHRTLGSVDKCSARLKLNGRGSLESVDDASHVAVVNQSLYNGSLCRSYMSGEMRLVHNGSECTRSNLFSVMEQDGGYSSSQVEGWV